MSKRTIGTLYTSGSRKFWYIRYKHGGIERRIRLLDPSGNPISAKKEAAHAAARLLAKIRETNKAEQLRMLKNDLQDAETAAAEADALLRNSKATIACGWQLFMSCPNRPASCKRMTTEYARYTTKNNYHSYFNKFSAWIMENYQIHLLSDVTQEIASEFMEKIRRENSSGTHNKYLQFLKCFFSTLIKSKKITSENPFSNIDKAALEYNSKKPLTIEQIALLINRATGDMRLLVALGYFCGLRLGDSCTLLWSEIDLSRRIIQRVPSKTAHTVKDKAQAAVKIGIPPYLFQMLEAVPEQERHGYLLPNFAVRYNASGAHSVSRQIMKFFESCGISTHKQYPTGKKKGRAIVEFGYHSLRYSYISHSAEKGTPQAVIQKNAGHGSPEMTERYIRISDDAARRYANLLQLPKGKEDDTIDASYKILEAEREELRRLADTLPINCIRKILQNWDKI